PLHNPVTSSSAPRAMSSTVSWTARSSSTDKNQEATLLTNLERPVVINRALQTGTTSTGRVEVSTSTGSAVGVGDTQHSWMTRLEGCHHAESISQGVP